MISTEHTHEQVALYTLSRLDIGMYVYIHLVIINEKENMNLKEKKEGLEVWKKRGNNVIIS